MGGILLAVPVPDVSSHCLHRRAATRHRCLQDSCWDRRMCRRRNCRSWNGQSSAAALPSAERVIVNGHRRRRTSRRDPSITVTPLIHILPFSSTSNEAYPSPKCHPNRNLCPISPSRFSPRTCLTSASCFLNDMGYAAIAVRLAASIAPPGDACCGCVSIGCDCRRARL